MPKSGDLREARDAFEHGAWARAYEAFDRADATTPVPAADLENWAAAAYLLGDDHDFVRLLDRAQQRYLDQGDTLRAAHCACWLALSLGGIGAHAQASGWLARARRLLAGESDVTSVHGYLHLADALAAVAQGEIDEALERGQVALEIAGRHGEADLAALTLQLLGRIYLRRSLTEEGYALLDEAMTTVSSGALNPQVAGIVYCSVIDGCRAGYSLRRAHEWTQALTRMCEQQPELVAFTGECRVFRAEMHVLHGAWQEALHEAERAFESLAPWSARKITALAWYQRGEVFRLRGDFEAAEQAYETAGREGGKRQPGLALLRLAQGAVAVAESGIKRVLEETTEPLLRASYLPARVTIALAAEQPDLAAARQAAEELVTLAARHRTTSLGTMAANSLAEVALAEGDKLEAAARLRIAVEGWLELAAPYQAARARVLLSRAYDMLEDGEGAALELAAAREAFEALGAAADLALLAQGGGRTGVGSNLTERELQVLKLLVEGETNRAIALRLSISERTVDRHVSNIFDKLGVGTRTEAATLAVRHELV